MHRRRFGAAAALVVTALPLAEHADAQTAPADLVAPGGAGQQALAVSAGAGGVRARVCAAAAGCSPTGGTAVEVPEDVTPLLGRARASDVRLVGGRHVVRVDVDGNQSGTRFVLLLGAPLAGKPAEPLVLWRGWVGTARGEHGEERSGVVLQETQRGGERVVVGERREDVSICGRPTLVGTKEIDPATLRLERVVWPDNLPRGERERAVRLTATRATGPAPETAPLLRATAASSAVERKFATLTDGDASTAWIENDKSGVGRGEFVTMSADTEVPIDGFDLTFLPAASGQTDAEGAAPRRLYVATSDRLFEVTVPEDAWRGDAGARWQVKLPEALRTACVALVLDEAYAPAGKPARVTVAELRARTPFDGSPPSALAGALAGGGERAKGAAALLARSGKAGVEAAARAYDSLDEEGKRLAVHVVESGDCTDQVPFFVKIVVSQASGAGQPKRRSGPLDDARDALDHARDRLRRCGRASAPALAELVQRGSPAVRGIAAGELALIAPSDSVPVLADAIAGAKDDDVRRELRTALAFAAQSDRALEAFAAELDARRWDGRDDKTRIDVLRALGEAAPKIPAAAGRVAALATPGASFRTRYLMLAPASVMAKAGDDRATRFVRAAMHADADRHVRARAAEVAAGIPALSADLVAAAEDAEPRVRDASVVALAKSSGPAIRAAATAAMRRLRIDDWTFVRTNAARTLGTLPADRSADAALALALEDRAPDVRSAALDALGAHRALGHREAVRDRAEDRDETVDVRAHAILALGEMCDSSSADLLTKLAHRARSPLDERDRRLGAAAIDALGRLHPPDLRERLSPLLEKDAFVGARELAKDALAMRETCRR